MITSLRCPLGLYISEKGGAGIVSNQPLYFQATEDPHGVFSFRTAGGLYLSAWDDRTLRFAPHRKDWELFKITKSGTSCTLRTHFGLYVSVEGGCLVQSEKQSPWAMDPLTVTFGESVFDITKALHDLVTNGFVLLPILSETAAREVKAILSELERKGNGSRNAFQHRIACLVELHPIFAKIVINPVIDALMTWYLGAHFRCATWSSNTLLPNMKTHGDAGWHVDYPYHDLDYPWPKQPLSAQVLWLLDDFTAENGGTGFFEGSHVFQRYPDANTINNNKERVNILEAKKGHVLIAHGAWWHTQRPNKTSVDRSALLANFTRSYVQPKQDMAGQVSRITYMNALSPEEISTLIRLMRANILLC